MEDSSISRGSSEPFCLLHLKYDRLLDDCTLSLAMGYALNKELGVTDKARDFYVKVYKNMLPRYLGIAYKVLKAISPGKAFKQVVDQYVYTMQSGIPLSNIELTRVSDREAVVRVKNCPYIKRMKDVVKKAGLDLDPRFMCEDETRILPEVVKEFGIDATMELEENGCITRAKLK